MTKVAQVSVKKVAANVNTDKVQGEALAHTIVAFAWKEANAVEERGQKMKRFVADIVALPNAEAHSFFRAQLSDELKALDEADKMTNEATGVKESRTNGYSLNSFRVIVSYLRGISVACGLGFNGKRADGEPMAWTEAITASKELRTAHANNTGSKAEGSVRKGGAGRKALTAYDKALKAVTSLNRKDQIKMLQSLSALLGYDVEAKTKSKAQQSTAAAIH